MKALLVQQVLSTAIDEQTMVKLKQSNEDKTDDIEEKAHNAILLSLGNEVL